jgi:hypothetical protein
MVDLDREIPRVKLSELTSEGKRFENASLEDSLKLARDLGYAPVRFTQLHHAGNNGCLTFTNEEDKKGVMITRYEKSIDKIVFEFYEIK